MAVHDSGLSAAAAAAVHCLGVGPSDDVLVLCNQQQRTIAESLAGAAGGWARTVRLVAYPTLTRDGEEPPAFVAEAMTEATVIFAPTTFSLSHTRARREATGRGARIATMPGITAEIFERAVSVDPGELKRAGERIAAELSAAASCRVTSPAGTDLVLSLEGRTAICDDGNLQAEAAWGNLPAGEAFIAPIETSGEGSIVFDGAIAGHGMLRKPLRVTLTRGRAIAADGEAAKWLLDTLDAGGPTGRLIAELPQKPARLRVLRCLVRRRTVADHMNRVRARARQDSNPPAHDFAGSGRSLNREAGRRERRCLRRCRPKATRTTACSSVSVSAARFVTGSKMHSCTGLGFLAASPAPRIGADVVGRALPARRGP